MLPILFALILPPVGFKSPPTRESAAWRSARDGALFLGGFVPALVMGVAVGNVLQGVPFRFGSDLRIYYDGTTLFELLNPFGLLAGLLSFAMLVMHGAAWLILKSEGPVAERSRTYGSVAAIVTVALFAIGGLWLWLGIDGYRITSEIVTTGASNPLAKTVEQAPGVWFGNYAAYPWMMIGPALGFLGAIAGFVFLRAKREVTALLSTSVSILGIISTVGLSMFPFILPSSIDARSSLTVWDASSSHLTLFIMLVVTVVFVPIIVAYTAWVYRVLWGKVDAKAISEGSGHAY
jgi:cytochrome d ubiquinol oxidase subunit II